jgi:enterochelin esterase family protein
LLFINRITDEKNLTESLMKRIPGTDVWHLAYRMETDWRASYCFLPCYNREKLADITGIEQTSIRKALDSGMTDPRNSRQCRNRTGNSLSVVELADAPTQPWLGIMPHVTKRGNVTSHQLADGHVVWVYEPPFEDAAQRRDVPALIMFDGDMWTSGELFPETLNNLIFEGKIPPLYALLVESSDLSSRWEELCEDAGIERFLINRLLSWARTQYPITKDASRLILAGQSLGGLAALWTVMKRPDYIQNIIAQSSSLWRGSLMKRLGDSKTSPLRGFTGRIYLEVGRQEWVLLPLHRELAKVFKKQGLEHRYVEYNGGHDYVCWRGGIADGLCWITQGWIKTSEG